MHETPLYKPALPQVLISAQRPLIEPLFLPWSGCAVRCVFCGQDVQTGQQSTAAPGIGDYLDKAAQRFAALGPQPPTGRELAFYGGTFTALPEADFSAALNFFQNWRNAGVFSTARCSTRPDAVGPHSSGPLPNTDRTRLERMADAGFSIVELGVQSFDTAALTLCKRPYTGATVREAVDCIRAAGLVPGIQLLPGMPGVTPQRFLEDMRESLALRPAFLRLYPCLVLEGTPLAAWWRAGRFRPWGLDETVEALAQASLEAWRAEIPIIRTGLAPEAALADAVLDGPRHPALGHMVQSRALYLWLRDELAQTFNGHLPAGTRIYLPGRLQGLLFGQKNCLEEAYAVLGIHASAIVWAEEGMRLTGRDRPRPD